MRSELEKRLEKRRVARVRRQTYAKHTAVRVGERWIGVVTCRLCEREFAATSIGAHERGVQHRALRHLSLFAASDRHVGEWVAADTDGRERRRARLYTLQAQARQLVNANPDFARAILVTIPLGIATLAALIESHYPGAAP
jgi:hypothetical protein